MNRARPEVWYAIPSASPEKARRSLPAWRERGYRVAVLQNQEAADVPADRVLWADHYPGWAASINRLHREVVPPSADLIVSGGDDMWPDPDRSAGDLANDFFDRFPDGFGVMQPCGDGFFGSQNFCGSPWLGRSFCERMYRGRGPMWPGYRHNYADLELHHVAGALGVLWMRPEVIQAHEHFSRSGEEEPAWWTRNVAGAEKADLTLFLRRRDLGFPGHEPVGPHPPPDPDWVSRNAEPIAERTFVTRDAPRPPGCRDAAAALEGAFRELAADGVREVALYGAGSHTLRGVPALPEAPVRITAVLDDAAPPVGRDAAPARFLGFPLLRPADLLRLAPARRPGAVVLSSDAFEHGLFDRSAPLRAAGLRVVRLHDTPDAPR